MKKKTVVYLSKNLQNKILAFILLAFLACFFSETALAQDITLSGNVVNISGEPIPGVTVMVKGTTIGTVTDVNGNYTLENLPDDGIMRFSFIGMLTEEIEIQGQTKLDLVMVEDVMGLDEVVVIGYGSLKRSDLTGSVASVKGETLSEIPGATAAMALQGRAAGVLVQQNSGAPGASLQIRIRGTSSIKGGNEPLWVVDGFEVSNADLLNLNDIETIDILKDASATAIYGSRGANGVIIVTTKQGVAGKTKVTYNGGYGIHTLRKKLDMCNAKEYMEVINIMNKNDGSTIDLFSEAELENITTDTDWQDLVYRQAKVHDHSINISGGTEKTKAAFGTSYFDEEGIVKNTGFKRLVLRTNINHEISKMFDLTFNTILSRTQDNEKDDAGGQRGGNFQQAAYAAPPIFDPYNEDGSYTIFGEEYAFVNPSFVNPVAYVNEITKGWHKDKTMANLALNIKPIEGLTVKLSGNVLNTNYRWDRYHTLKYPGSVGSAGIDVRQILELASNNIVTYTKKINNHNFTIMGGTTCNYFRKTGTAVTGKEFVHDVLETYDIGSSNHDELTASSSYEDWKLLSFLGRLNYSYKDTYLATVSFRRDGSSRFTEGKKWSSFPSFSFAWRISEESFLKNIDFISNLKLRGGYGVVGNPSVDAYGTLNLLTSVHAVWDKNAVSGFDPTSTYPGELHWETSEQYNIGLDISVFRNRVTLVSEYYIKNTKDLINNVQLSPSSGYTSTVKNIGKIKNTGLEFQLDAIVIDQEFNWKISSNISFNWSEVVKLFQGQDIQGSWYSLGWMGDYVNILKEGEPFGVFYGYKEAGYNDEGFILYKNSADSLVLGGDVTPEDRTIIGDPNPDFTYGFNSIMSYKGFSLSMFFQGVQGRDVFNMSMGSTNYDYGFGVNTFKEVRYNHWSEDNTAEENKNAKYPKLSSKQIYQVSDRFIYDGSYLRLKNIELAYNIPLKKLGVTWLSKAQVYTSGQNLWTLTDYPWFDPEVNSRGGSNSINQGIDHHTYPTYKSVMFGMRLEF